MSRFKKLRSVPVRLRLAVFCIAVGLALGAAAAVLYVQDRRISSMPPPPLPQLVKSPGEAVPPAPVAKPSRKTVDSYHVAPDLPEYLSIPAIGIDKVRILSLGLTGDGHIAVPGSSYDTGWYDGSAKPGQPGAMFIYGHVAGWNTGGIFYNLKKLKPGDKLIVTRGDGTAYTYRVNALKVYPAADVDMGAVLSPIDPGKAGLNLMTCVWSIVDGKSEFNSRQVVFASLANG